MSEPPLSPLPATATVVGVLAAAVPVPVPARVRVRVGAGWSGSVVLPAAGTSIQDTRVPSL